MAKTKNNKAHLPLVVTGYILFFLLTIGVLVSTTIPFGIMLFNPRVLHGNVAVLLIALTVGALLPVTLGYIIGDQSVKTKNRLSHHFNGVLFGLLAFWVATLFSVFVTLPAHLLGDNQIVLPIVINNLLPAIAVAAIAAALAIGHVRSSRAKQDVLAYKPFSLLLIACIVALPLWSLIYNIATNTLNIWSFLDPIGIILFGVVSYFTLRKTRVSMGGKVVWAAVSISSFYIAMYISSYVTSTVSSYVLKYPSAEDFAILGWVGFALAIIGWGTYWFYQVRALRSK